MNAALPCRPTIGVVVIVAGRRDHLAAQVEGLRRQSRPADRLVVVRMDAQEVDVARGAAGDVAVVDLPRGSSRPGDSRLPLAAARNLGVRVAATDVVVLLDVDCIPGVRLVAAYADAVAAADGLVSGPLRYLEPGAPAHPRAWREPDLVAASRLHPARPVVRGGQVLRRDLPALAWTASLALRRTSFEAVGGFDETFRGYGGEDTDFAYRAVAAGMGGVVDGDAVAYHQHHPAQDPPVQHLDDIVRNATIFERRHGWYPMEGWLNAFRDLGLVDFEPSRGVLVRRPVASTR